MTKLFQTMIKKFIFIVIIAGLSGFAWSFFMVSDKFVVFFSEIISAGSNVFSADGLEISQSFGSTNLGSRAAGGEYEVVGGGIAGGYSLAAEDLSNVKVYPNPYKPGSGSKYDNPQEGEGIIFENLTQGTKVKIFNIAGELVAEFEDTDGDGRYLWNTRDLHGNKVASGVYIYHIKNLLNKAQSKKGRIVIIR